MPRQALSWQALDVQGGQVRQALDVGGSVYQGGPSKLPGVS